jgi:hypothetical protein
MQLVSYGKCSLASTSSYIDLALQGQLVVTQPRLASCLLHFS